jgi:hypothetical protein
VAIVQGGGTQLVQEVESQGKPASRGHKFSFFELNGSFYSIKKQKQNKPSTQTRQ